MLGEEVVELNTDAQSIEGGDSAGNSVAIGKNNQSSSLVDESEMVELESEKDYSTDSDSEVEITDEEKLASLEIKRDRLIAREELLLNFDRVFLSEGLRLLIILPAVATLSLFLGWFADETSPLWWSDSIEVATSLRFVEGMALLGFVVLFGDLCILGITRQRYTTTHAIFRLQGIRYRLEGRPLESMHGTSSLRNHTAGVIQHRNLALIV
ncbi:MAG: hypothetical protein QGH90_02805, partial [Candidatus Poseidoniaceae archaeon]|nr:hypothetical protein [Candidatus Poseidoniaceae archaeon]